MKRNTLTLLSTAALLLLGVHFGAAQSFTTSLAAAAAYGYFPQYGAGYQATCLTTTFSQRFAFANETYIPASDGIYQITFAFPSPGTSTAYLYSSDPALNTTAGCVSEYGANNRASYSWNATLTSGTTYYVVILTNTDAVSGNVTVGLVQAFTTTPVPTTQAPSTTPAATTESPSSTPAPTTPAPTTQPATTQPDTTLPNTTPPDTTAPDTSAPDTTPPDTTPPDTTLPGTTQPPPTASPGVTTPVPQTTQVISTSQPLASSTPVVTQAPTTTIIVPSTPAVPATTPAPATSLPLASTTPPPTTANVTVALTMDFTPNPPLSGQPLTIFGDAVASSGPAPTGNVTIYVDGVPVATTPVVPEGSSGRRLQQSPKSVFSVTITAPSTPGVHVIIAVFFPDSGSGSGGSTPVAAPVTVDVNIPPANATVSLALSSSSLLFPFCTKPLKAVASVSGTNGLPQPTGNVTLSISGDKFAALRAHPVSEDIGTAPLIASVATFVLKATGPIDTLAEALKGTDESTSTKLLPGSYQLTASYPGDTLYGPAAGSASLIVGPKCSLSSLAMSSSLA